MSCPSSNTWPAIDADGIISCMRLRMRRNVDLPQPDGPISAVTLPAGMSSDTRSSTLCVPNQAEMLRACRPASALGTVPVADCTGGEAIGCVTIGGATDGSGAMGGGVNSGSTGAVPSTRPS
ncbi:unannotated protein [freshwater metagenome]|uniref:Unannotated protein n=1 Tax=freshwater metagenome TaxID=449393 RepID=A0A6J7L3K9_9ZZZZ